MQKVHLLEQIVKLNNLVVNFAPPPLEVNLSLMSLLGVTHSLKLPQLGALLIITT